jgi:hypothetical protein
MEMIWVDVAIDRQKCKIIYRYIFYSNQVSYVANRTDFNVATIIDAAL